VKKSRWVRHSALTGKQIKVSLGGSGMLCYKNAIMAGADAFLTADLKYHQFYEAENQLLLNMDILKANAIQKLYC
jgi:putative NIF3 family GTP cyclohydrolase 1 type 2